MINFSWTKVHIKWLFIPRNALLLIFYLPLFIAFIDKAILCYLFLCRKCESRLLPQRSADIMYFLHMYLCWCCSMFILFLLVLQACLRQTDTSVWNLVISPRLRVAGFISTLWVLWSPWNFNCYKMRLCWSKSILQGACPCLLPTTVLWHLVVLRLSPVLWFARNVVEKLAHSAGKLHPEYLLGAFPQVINMFWLQYHGT